MTWVHIAAVPFFLQDCNILEDLNMGIDSRTLLAY